MPDLELNFQFTSSAQKLSGATREVAQGLSDFARLIVDEVAIATAEGTYARARRSLVTGIRRAVLSEITRMASLIGRSFSLPDKYTGPYGQMSIKEGMSTTAQLLGFRSSFSRERSGIKWSKRSKRYLSWKREHGMPAMWWEATGELVDDLSDPDLYTENFGPVVVKFVKGAAVRGSKGRFQRQRNNAKAGALDPDTFAPGKGALPQTAFGGINITRSGRSGFVTEYEVGRLEVQVFGRVTPAMLPLLSTPNWDPAKSKPSGGEGLAGLLPDGETKVKLIGRQAQRRYALEPFVGFYLGRAIPNAIWRRTEQLVSNKVFSRHSGGVADTEDFSTVR